MNQYVSLPIQLGFDVATSLTIIGSLIYVAFSVQKRMKNERKQRFDEQARAVAANQLKASLGVLSELFINEIISASEKTKRASEKAKHASKLSKNEDFKIELDSLKEDVNLEEIIQCLSEANSQVVKFYEALNAEKFRIIPVINALEDSPDLVHRFNEQLAQVGNTSNGSVGALLKQLRMLQEDIDGYMEKSGVRSFEELQSDDENFNELMSKAVSIVYDEEYLHWTLSFIEEDDELAFENAVKNTVSLSEMDEKPRQDFLNLCATLIGQMMSGSDSVYRYYSQIIYKGVSQQVVLNTACKELLINLSGMLKYLLMKDTSCVPVSQTIERYKSVEYFDLENKIR